MLAIIKWLNLSINNTDFNNPTVHPKPFPNQCRLSMLAYLETCGLCKPLF